MANASINLTKVLLIVTSKDDLTTDYLIRRLGERGLPFFRFNTEDSLSQFQISLRVDGRSQRFTLTDVARNVTLESGQITGAYFRKPTPPKLEHDEEVERLFNEGELRETLRSLWRLIPEGKWLNSPECLWLAGNKIKQLAVSKEVGFRVPETVITSSPAEAISFIERHGGNVIIKAVKNGFLLREHSATVVFTSELNESDRLALGSSRSVVPSILQPKLEKRLDLRITVVGDRVFPVALFSQAHPQTAVDWRVWDLHEGLDLKHEVFDLPDEIASMCRQLNRRLRLNFSCIDMVLTRGGEYFFLEVNPNGQWAWIEDLLHLPIRDAIIDRLIGA